MYIGLIIVLYFSANVLYCPTCDRRRKLVRSFKIRSFLELGPTGENLGTRPFVVRVEELTCTHCGVVVESTWNSVERDATVSFIGHGERRCEYETVESQSTKVKS
jgi:hypothetical protein